MFALRHAWHQLLHRLDQRTQRERAILCFAILVIAYAIADATVLGSGFTRLQAANRSAASLRLETQQKQQQTQALGLMLQADPNAPYRQQQQQLEEQLRAGEERLATIESTLVQPRQALGLLRDIIKAHPGVKISSLKLLPPQAIRDDSAPTSTAASAGPSGEIAATSPVLLWRHDIELQLDGSYLDILAYVEALERQPWRFTWPQLTIETTTPGRAHATLIVGSYTLTNALVKL